LLHRQQTHADKLGVFNQQGMGQGLHYSNEYTTDRLGVMAQKAEKMLPRILNECAMCNFFQESESSKYREKLFGYLYPYPVSVWKQFLDIPLVASSLSFRIPMPVSSEISDFTPCTHAQSRILHTKYADRTDD